MSDPNKGRIAIKFGAGPSTSKSKPPPPPPQALGKRSRAALGDNDDSDSDNNGAGHHEVITGFDADGAETAARKARAAEVKKDYVIARQPNRDWRSEIRTQRRGNGNLLPEEERQRRNGNSNGVMEREPPDEEKPLQWGLNVKKEENCVKQEEDAETSNDSAPTTDPPVKKEEGDEVKDVKKEEEDGEEENKPPRRSTDDEAMDALLGRNPQDQTHHIIQPSETDAFRRDIEAAGETSTLADYEAMPVEEFGAALLRGMGWDGKERGTMRHKQVKRRPNRLGLGAKELKEAEDLGGWNQGDKKKKRPRLDEYRREESKRKEGRVREDSYKRERERERESERRDRHHGSHRDRDRDYSGRRDRHRDYDRDRRR